MNECRAEGIEFGSLIAQTVPERTEQLKALGMMMGWDGMRMRLCWRRRKENLIFQVDELKGNAHHLFLPLQYPHQSNPISSRTLSKKGRP
jgi:hypothetical protein